MIAYFIIVIIVVTGLTSLAYFTSQSSNMTHRRTDLVSALQYAQGGAVIAASDIESAFNATNYAFPVNLTNSAYGGYSFISALSTNGSKVYQRTLTATFTNQSVALQISVPSALTTAKITSSATVNKVTQNIALNMVTKFGYGAAIISMNAGTSATSTSKDTTSGNVAVSGVGGTSTLVVYGGSGWAILANGRANVDVDATVPAGAISMTNWGTANQIPDFTAQGTADTLFDFTRFMCVASNTPNPFMTNNVPFKSNYFTNRASFIGAVIRAGQSNKFMEGVIVVNVKKAELSPNLDDAIFGNYPVNIHGTLLFYWDAATGPLDKMFNLATFNINPANLSGFNATNSTTYTSGYPPVYQDWTKHPTNINIAPYGFNNFTADDDLPALMYNKGILDMHGDFNISGVMYTPSFVEIENKADNQIQYLKGTVMSGGGVYFENNKNSKSVISFDGGALDRLATAGTKGKKVFAAFWE